MDKKKEVRKFEVSVVKEFNGFKAGEKVVVKEAHHRRLAKDGFVAKDVKEVEKETESTAAKGRTAKPKVAPKRKQTRKATA